MDIRPWDRQENESSAAFEAFVLYRDARPRSLSQVAEKLGKHKSVLGDWSKTHDWVARCHKWDVELDSHSQQSQIDELSEMKRRQIAMAIEMQTLAMQALNLLKEALDQGKRGLISADNMIRMADIGAKLERLNRDEPDTITRVQEHDYSKLSVEEMTHLRTLLLKSRRGDVAAA